MLWAPRPALFWAPPPSPPSWRAPPAWRRAASTGLTGLVSAALFGIALFLSPIFLAIPSFATAPALIVVGFLMVSSILKVGASDDPTQAIPAFICMISMPFMYSISEGISMGVITYVVINLIAGGEKRKTISPLMYILAILFAVKYFII